ncbi:MAG: hypothetical protein ABIK89_06040 [Planctomycetota bacterium]
MSIARTTFHASAFLLVFSSVCAGADTAGPDILPSGLAPKEVENRRYLDYARECVELLLRHGTYAGLYDRTISFLLHLHSLTGEDAYRAFAREVAKEAVSKLYYQGLLRGHPAKPYYESVDGVGYLLCALVQLDQSLEGRGDGNVSMLNW